MKILVLSWEFPPRIVGGIARHAAELYPELVKLGHEVHLITVEFGQAPPYEIVEGIKVYRVSVAPGIDFFQWIAHMNESMGDRGGKLIRTEGSFDIIHAHDWLVGDAAVALQHHFNLPLIVTIHATEAGRHNGLHTKTQQYIGQKEVHLTHHAWRVIVCSHYMRQEITHSLRIPWDKINVIYNGVRAEKKCIPVDFDARQFRRQFAADGERIIYYVGRLTYEKGISVLLNAVPRVFAEMKNQAKLVIIGVGTAEELKAQAWHLGIWDKCYFTGFMSDMDLDRFQTIADCAVFPSLYEPFGIVVLESFAAKVPVVVSDAGGLPEIVRHGETGIVTSRNNPHSLSAGILEILQKPSLGEQLVESAYLDLCTRFNWSGLAQQTELIYKDISAK